MTPEEYKQMALVKKDNWWFKGKRALVRQLLDKYSHPSFAILDNGCGTGELVRELDSLGYRIMGIDVSKEAAKIANSPNVIHTSLSCVGNQNKAITCLDVLEHIEDDIEEIERIWCALHDNGILIFTVPAHPSLWSHHDKLLGHFRRYSIHEIESKLSAVGFGVIELGYYNCLFGIPIAILRIAEKFFGWDKPYADTPLLPTWFNWICWTIFRIEIWLLRYVPMPFGVSIYGVAKKI